MCIRDSTIVTPIKKGEIPKDIPIFSAASVKKSEAFIRTNKLTINIISQIIKFCISLLSKFTPIHC